VSNVHKLPVKGVFTPGSLQTIQDFDYSDFCVLLEAGTAENRVDLNGMTILQYPYASIICHGDHCTCVASQGASIGFYLREAEAALDRHTAEAAA
jgi:hypothetical protein